MNLTRTVLFNVTNPPIWDWQLTYAQLLELLQIQQSPLVPDGLKEQIDGLINSVEYLLDQAEILGEFTWPPEGRRSR